MQLSCELQIGCVSPGGHGARAALPDPSSGGVFVAALPSWVTMSSAIPMSSMSTYAILGCGSVGHTVAEELDTAGKDVVILDQDEGRVEALRDQDLDARRADIADDAIVDLVGDRDVILVMSSDDDANKAAVQNIKAEGREQFVIVRASDPVTADELTSIGVDVIINPSAVIADSALRALETGELEYRAVELGNVIESGATLAIVVSKSPDPDSIAAATALKAIAEASGVEAQIIYEGDIGHEENRAFVNLLDIALSPAEEVELDAFDNLALVEYAMSGEYGLDREPDIVIDTRDPEMEFEPTFVDVRASISSASTMLTKYVQEFDLSLTEEVATSLLYGIRAETLDFKRDTTAADLTAAAYLYPFADHDTLEQVESPSLSPETLEVLADAIRNRDVQGAHLVTNAGFVRDREAISQAAQQLLNLEGITTTAVFAIADETIHLSARSKDLRINIGDVLIDAFGDMGDVVGHATDATVEIPLGIFTGLSGSNDSREVLMNLVEEAVRSRVFEAMGLEGSTDGTNSS